MAVKCRKVGRNFSTINLVLIFVSIFCQNYANAVKVVVKVDKYVTPPAGTCQSIQAHIQNFFTNSSAFLFESTSQLTQLTEVLFEFPATWTGCGDIRRKRIPTRAADVIVKAGNTKSVQAESCGIKGKRMFLNANMLNPIMNQEAAQKEFVREWIKYEYGVFDEHGHSNSQVYPEFYKKVSKVLPNSCANQEVTGNFTDSCLADPSSCQINANQAGITSSILYSLDSTKFPNMRKVCDSTTHNQDGPNQQNLLCRYKSVLEVIQQRTGFNSKLFRAPVVTFVQDRLEEEIIIIQDIGAAMLPELYKGLRLGIEQLFTLMGPFTKISVIRAADSVNATLVGGATSQNYWSDTVFPENSPGNPEQLDLKAAFLEVQTQLQYFQSPTVLILTATSKESEDLSHAIGLINENLLQVDVITFSGVRHPGLVDLAVYGNVYSISENVGTRLYKGLVSGSLLHQISNSILNLNLQQVHQKGHQTTSSSDSINGTFNLPNDVTSLTNPKLSIVFLTPWETQRPGITLTDPQGRQYLNYFEIQRQWTVQVHYVTQAAFVSGEWSFSIKKPTGGITTTEDLYISVQIDVGERLHGSGFLQRLGQRALNATGVFAFAVMAQLEGGGEGVNVTGFVAHQDVQAVLNMKDDGLTVPDISSSDGIYSQYFFELYHQGLYSTRFEVTATSGLTLNFHGPSFYVQVPLVGDGSVGDRIPPARITDLRVENVTGTLVTLTWTAPGDNLNDGQVNHYRIYCGYSRASLSYDDCKAFRGSFLISLGHEAGTKESLALSMTLLGTEVFLGVKAFDSVGNAGEMSNVPSVFVEGATTTTTTTAITTTTETTTPPTSTPVAIRDVSVANGTSQSDDNSTLSAPPTNNTNKPGVNLSKGEFIAIIVSFSVVLLLLLILLALYIWSRLKKKKEEERYRKVVRRQQPEASNGGNKSARNSNRNKPSNTLGSSSHFQSARGKQNHNQNNHLERQIRRAESETDSSSEDSDSSVSSVGGSSIVYHDVRGSRDAINMRGSCRGPSRGPRGSSTRSNAGYVSSPVDAIGSGRRSARSVRADPVGLEGLDVRALEGTGARSRAPVVIGGVGMGVGGRVGAPVVVAGGGAFQMQRQHTVEEPSMMSTSSANTFQTVNDWNFYSDHNDPRITSAHSAHSGHRQSGPRPRQPPPPQYRSQHRKHSRPEENGQPPFNYIAFSQMLYGEKEATNSAKAISFV